MIKTTHTTTTLRLLALASFTSGREIPTYEKIEDIKDARRVYITSEDEESRERIIKALGKEKTLRVFSEPAEAGFFNEYGVLRREQTTKDRFSC